MTTTREEVREESRRSVLYEADAHSLSPAVLATVVSMLTNAKDVGEMSECVLATLTVGGMPLDRAQQYVNSASAVTYKVLALFKSGD